jgi:hypothetical protein
MSTGSASRIIESDAACSPKYRFKFLYSLYPTLHKEHKLWNWPPILVLFLFGGTTYDHHMFSPNFGSNRDEGIWKVSWTNNIYEALPMGVYQNQNQTPFGFGFGSFRRTSTTPSNGCTKPKPYMREYCTTSAGQQKLTSGSRLDRNNDNRGSWKFSK